MTHTPTPWKAILNDSGRTFEEIKREDLMTPLPWHKDLYGVLRGPNNEDVLKDPENLDLIALAVNKHDELVEISFKSMKMLELLEEAI